MIKQIQTLGQKLSPILTEIEDTLWEFEANRPGVPLKFSQEGFRAAIKIFTCTLLEKMWDLQQKNAVPQKERERLVTEAGQSIRAFVQKYTGIDPHDLYKK